MRCSSHLPRANRLGEGAERRGDGITLHRDLYLAGPVGRVRRHERAAIPTQPGLGRCHPLGEVRHALVGLDLHRRDLGEGGNNPIEERPEDAGPRLLEGGQQLCFRPAVLARDRREGDDDGPVPEVGAGR